MAGKVEALWFIAGLTTGVIGTLVVSIPYLTDVVQTAEAKNKKAAPKTAMHSPAPEPIAYPKPITLTYSDSPRASVILAKDEMLLVRGSEGVAVVTFHATTSSSADYRWRCAGRAGGTMESGSGSVTRNDGEKLFKTLTLGKVSIDWLGGNDEQGTVLYYRGPTQVEERPAAEFETIDLAAEVVKQGQ